MIRTVYSLLLIVLLPSVALAIGGEGSTCDPQHANWSTCTKSQPSWAASVTNTVNVTGGTWSSPYAANAANTKYVLQGNVTANSSGFLVTANYVIIDLNGYTLTYNQSSAGEGVATNTYNLHHLGVINGSIIQGAALSPGTSISQGNAPVTSHHGQEWESTDIYLANLVLHRKSQDVGGVVFNSATGSTAENIRVIDSYFPGTLTNRHNSIGHAINLGGALTTAGNNIVRNCTITDTRQVGIKIGPSGNVYNNYITIKSIATNSSGISLGTNSSAYNNTITGVGAHPIGIYVGWDAENVYIYGNYISTEITALEEEYAGGYPNNDPDAGQDAGGIRMTSIEGHCNSNVSIYNNTIEQNNLEEGATVIWAMDGVATQPMIKKGYAIRIGQNDCVGATPTVVRDNRLSVRAVDGENIDSKYGYIIGLAVNSTDQLFIINNDMSGNVSHVSIDGNYGPSDGFPLVAYNNFIKTSGNTSYRTYTQSFWQAIRTARFVDNIYIGGASESSTQFSPNVGFAFDVYFGENNNGDVTYYKRLHNNDGSSGTVTTVDYGTPITLAYDVPSGCDAYPSSCATESACTTTWPGYVWSGGQCRSDVIVIGGKMSGGGAISSGGYMR
jgi:hypothetical protein